MYMYSDQVKPGQRIRLPADALVFREDCQITPMFLGRELDVIVTNDYVPERKTVCEDDSGQTICVLKTKVQILD